MFPYWVIVLFPSVYNGLIQPQFDKGSFSPTTNWNTYSQKERSEDQSASATISRGHSDLHPPCNCCHHPDPPMATITPIPSSLTLSCQTPFPYEHISWWLFKCPEHGDHKNVVQVTSGSITYLKDYEVITDHNEKGYFSSLFIKDISSEETSGLYQCVSHVLAPSQTSPYFSRTDYFVIGKRTTMRNCIYDALSREDFKRQIKEKTEYINYREPRFGEIFMPENTIVFNFSDAIPDPIQHQFEDVLKPPPVQNLTEIPVQNSSYVRFDFTGGDKIQNRKQNETESVIQNKTVDS